MSEISLVAPRPIRIPALTASAVSPIARRLTGTSPPAHQPDSSNSDDVGRLSPISPSERAVPSPRLSPRPSSEALEEFLSILRPAIPALFTAPASPSMRPRVYNLPSLHDRALSLSSGPLADRLENIPRDGIRTPFKSLRMRTPGLEDENTENNGVVASTPPARAWVPQASPVSRFQTRNPFQRHPSYEYPSSTPKLSSPSPAMYPLPPPTPSELEVF